jgi:hypothetical protein
MIRFDLVCTHDHAFEGWFRNGQAFDDQAAASELTCPFCGDAQVRKAVMAPSIARRRGGGPEAAGEAPPTEGAAGAAPPMPAPPQPPMDPRRAAFIEAVRMIRKVQTFVEKNFDNVGERFPAEARKMHHGEIEHRAIYGRASPDEVEALEEEGIGIRALPMLPKLDG